MKSRKKETIVFKPLSRKALSKVQGGAAADDCGNCRLYCYQHYPPSVCIHIMCSQICGQM